MPSKLEALPRIIPPSATKQHQQQAAANSFHYGWDDAAQQSGKQRPVSSFLDKPQQENRGHAVHWLKRSFHKAFLPELALRKEVVHIFEQPAQ